jgi:hypothetical protein
MVRSSGGTATTTDPPLALRSTPLSPAQPRPTNGQWRQPDSQHEPRAQWVAAVMTNSPLAGSG